MNSLMLSCLNTALHQLNAGKANPYEETIVWQNSKISELERHINVYSEAKKVFQAAEDHFVK
jgi:hypothetical protein